MLRLKWISALVLGAFLPTELSAQHVWTGVTNTSWDVAGNWSTNQVPTLADAVTIPATTTKPSIGSGMVAVCASLLVEDGGRLDLTGGDLTVVGDVSFGNTPDVSTGVISITGSLSVLAVQGVWTQDDSEALEQSSGLVEFSGGAIAGAEPKFARLAFGAGTTTLYSPAQVTAFIDMQSGSSTTGAGWVEIAAVSVCELLSASTAHDIRLVSGICRPNGSLVQLGDLTLLGGTLQLGLFQIGGDVEILGTIKLQGGKIQRLSVAADVIVSGSWDQDDPEPFNNDVTVRFGDGSHALGSGLKIQRAVFLSGESTLEVPMQVTTFIDMQSGSSTTGAGWIEIAGGCELLAASTSHDIHLVSGNCRPNGALVQLGDLTLLGGALFLGFFQTGGDVEIVGTIKLQGGKILRLSTAADVIVTGTWNQDDANPFINDVTVQFGDGSNAMGMAQITGQQVQIPRMRVMSGSTTLVTTTVVSQDLDVASGATLDVGAQTLSVSDVTGTISGTLRLGPGGKLQLLSGGDYDVTSGGTLALHGALGLEAVVESISDSPGYDLTINGTLEAANAVLRGMSSAGVVLSSTASLGAPPYDLRSVTFEQTLVPTPTSFDLLVDNIPGAHSLAVPRFKGPADMVGAPGAKVRNNIRRLATGGNGFVTVVNALGNLAGPDHEDDAGDTVVWQDSTDPDLVATGLTTPSKGIADQTLDVSWMGQNQGGVDALAPWQDRLVLTTNTVLGDGDDIQLGTVDLTSDVMAGASYAESLSPTIPTGTDGNYYVAVELDWTDQVTEPGAEANNVRFSPAPLLITSAPRADLVVTSISLPAATEEGESVEIAWTVLNQGTGDADASGGPPWTDSLFLSTDTLLSGSDLFLGSFAAPTSNLAVDASYQATEDVVLPDGLTGTYFVLVRCDAQNAIAEGPAENNNVGAGAPVLLEQFDLPDLVATSIELTSGEGVYFVGAEATATVHVRNQDPDMTGKGAANGHWFDRLWLSADATLGGGDTLLKSASFAGLALPEAEYSFQRTFTLPITPETWYLLAEVDSAGNVAEVDEGNNLLALPFEVFGPTYAATVQTSLEQGLSPSAPNELLVTLTGQAVDLISGLPVPDEDVSIRVRHKGTRRVFAVTTDASGDFSFVFEPLPGEAGRFDLYADHPAVAEDPVDDLQDSFELFDLRLAVATQTQQLSPGELVSGAVLVTNPGNTAVTGIAAAAVGVPGYLSLTPATFPTTLAPGASALFQYDVEAFGPSPDPNQAAPLAVEFSLDVAGGSEVAETLAVPTFVNSLEVELVVTGNELLGLPGMPVKVPAGEFSILRLSITNQGGAVATNLLYELPCESVPGVPDPPFQPCGFSVVTPTNLGNLAPGATTVIEIGYTPPGNLPIGTQVTAFFPSQMISVRSDQDELLAGYDLLIDSEVLASLELSVVDELSYWDPFGMVLDPPMPGLAGAAVELRRFNDPATFYTGTSDALGSVELFDALQSNVGTQVLEGTYALEIQAVDHNTYSATIQLDGGEALSLTCFLPFAAVEYSFDVVPTEVQEVYDITLEAIFKVIVPTPVFTVTPQLIDLDLAPGESMQVDLTIKNVGLITAFGVELFMDDLSAFQVDPLITDLGSVAGNTEVVVPVHVQRLNTGLPCSNTQGWGVRHYIQTPDFVQWYWTPIFYLAPVAECGTVFSPVAPSSPPPAPANPPPTGGGGSGGGFGSPGASGGGAGNGGSSGYPTVAPPPSVNIPTGCDQA